MTPREAATIFYAILHNSHDDVTDDKAEATDGDGDDDNDDDDDETTDMDKQKKKKKKKEKEEEEAVLDLVPRITFTQFDK